MDAAPPVFSPFRLSHPALSIDLVGGDCDAGLPEHRGKLRAVSGLGGSVRAAWRRRGNYSSDRGHDSRTARNVINNDGVRAHHSPRADHNWAQHHRAGENGHVILNDGHTVLTAAATYDDTWREQTPLPDNGSRMDH